MKMFTPLMILGVCLLLVEARPSTGRFDLVEGDMLLSEDQVDVYNQIKNGRERRAAMKGTVHLWPRGVVYYRLAGDLTQTAKNRVNQAIKHWMDRTCLKFRKVGPSAEGYILFKHDAGGACNSYVGYWNRAQPLNIGSKTDTCKLGSVIHEIGHAIGFYHEHVRPDRDRYVTYKEENVYSGISQRKKDTNWGKLDRSKIDSRGFQYDLGSIMHYSRLQGATSARKPVLVPKRPNVEIGQRNGLSKGDIAQAKNLYQCNAQGDSELENDPTLDKEEESGKPTEGPVINE